MFEVVDATFSMAEERLEERVIDQAQDDPGPDEHVVSRTNKTRKLRRVWSRRADQ